MTEYTLPVVLNSSTEIEVFQPFQELAKQAFSGQLSFSDTTGKTWCFYFSNGSIIYASGGTHPGRRWRRYLAAYCPVIQVYVVAWQRDLDQIDVTQFRINAEYTLLSYWISEDQISHQQAAQVAQGVVCEALFEIAQFTKLSHQIRQDSEYSKLSPLLEIEPAIASASALVKTWRDANLGYLSPYQATVIRRLDSLKSKKAAQFYQRLAHLMQTRQTLWDLAVKMRRSITDVATALLPGIQAGVVELVDLSDLPLPEHRSVKAFRPPQQTSHQVVIRRSAPPPPPLNNADDSRKLIACIDDSLWVQQTLERILASANYRFLGITDEMRAVSLLLTHKPDFIFLDLVMPKVNGYEICEQLRKLSRFRETPIVILTGNDGYANRLQSSFAGASHFLSKPLKSEAVLGIVQRYLGTNTAQF